MIQIPGLEGSPIADGRIRRYAAERRGKKSWWYVLHRDGDSIWGAFGDWKTGVRGTLREGVLDRRQVAHSMELANAKRADEGRRAALIAEMQWSAQRDTWMIASPYLERKKVNNYGVRFDRDVVLVPMRSVDGTLRGIQRIYPGGTKRFTRGCNKRGAFHTIPGDVAVVIAEGYATAASIHMATGLTCLVAFDCGNLEPVARAYRAMYPGAYILIAADDDRRTDGNPGVTHAAAAAKAIKARLVIPTGLQDGESDFNDLAVRAGLDEVARIVYGAL